MIESIDVITEELTLDRLQFCDAVLVGGSGEYSVLDESKIIGDFIDYLGEIVQSDIPMFASCFGFQALALAYGGKVVHIEDKAEVGTYEIFSTQAAASDPLFRSLPNKYLAQLGHQDHVVNLPSQFVHLAYSEKTDHQAYKVSNKLVYATQFHPELTYLDNRKRFARYMSIYGALFGEEEAQKRMDSHQPSPEANGLLAGFSALVEEHISRGR